LALRRGLNDLSRQDLCVPAGANVVDAAV
jgi:hypothetical protein